MTTHTSQQDHRKRLLQKWANTIWEASRTKEIFGRTPIQLKSLRAVSGPRAGALEIDAGISAGPLMKKLRADEHALHRQLIPWDFAGDPIVFMSSRYVRLEAGWPDGVAITDIRLSQMGQYPKGGGRWVAGMSEHGATITLGFSNRVPHYLFAGYTGSGKTYAMRSAIVQLAQDNTRLVLIDGKHGDGLMCLQNIPNIVGPVAITIPQARRALSWSVAEMRRRFESGGLKDNRSLPLVVVVIDEIQEFTRDDAITEMIRVLAAQGRGARVHLMIGTQHPQMDAFGSDSTIRRNLTGRLALQTADFSASQVVVGDTTPRADHLMGAGDAYALTPQATHRAQIAYIPDHELGQWAGDQPQLDKWPPFDPEAAGSMPTGDDAPKWSYSGKELAVGIVQAAQGGGRPKLQDAFEEAGLARPGSVRSDRLLKLARSTHNQLTAMNWHIINRRN